MEVAQSKLSKAFLVVFFLFMLIGMHYFQHNQGGYGLDLPFNAVSWCFISILIGLGLWQISIQQKVIFTPISIAGFVAFLFLLAPIFFPNNEFAESAYPRLFGYLGGILLLFSTQQFQFNEERFHQLLFFIVIGSVIEAIYSLLQMYILTVDNPFGYYPGYGRPWGIFQQPNVLASFIVTGLIASLYLISSWSFVNENKLVKASLYLSIFLLSWVAYICVSRTGYLSAIVGLLLISPWLIKKSIGRYIILSLVMLVGVFSHSIVSESPTAREKEQLVKAGPRALQFEQSWHMITEKPLQGWGYGSFEASFLKNRADRIQKEGVPFIIENLTHPHNELLFWTIEGGIIPLIGIIILASTFILQLKSIKLLNTLALISLIIPLLIHTQTEYPFYHSTASWAVFITLIAIISAKTNKEIKVNFRPFLLVRLSAILLPLITVAFMITAIQTNYFITKFERTGRTNIDLLMKVTNPLAQTTRLEFNIYTLRMLVGEQLNNPSELQAFINWAEQQVKETPRANIYWNLAYALKLSGNDQKSLEVLAQARYLFPENPQLKQNLNEVMRDLEKSSSEVSATQVPHSLKAR